MKGKVNLHYGFSQKKKVSEIIKLCKNETKYLDFKIESKTHFANLD